MWSTLYGFLALDKDKKTIKGLGFYEHAETPGLGGEVDNPNWKKTWVNKIAYNNSGKPIIKIVKGSVDPNAKAQRVWSMDCQGQLLLVMVFKRWLIFGSVTPVMEKS